jgi:hypothetical protein
MIGSYIVIILDGDMRETIILLGDAITWESFFLKNHWVMDSHSASSNCPSFFEIKLKGFCLP